MLTASSSPVSVVIATYDRLGALFRTLERLTSLPERPPIVVVDNGSSDGTQQAVRRHHPGITVIALPRNIGAAARTLGVEAAQTPYIAFCDDDCWWGAGSLARAARLLDAHPGVALLNARVLVGDEGRLDDACDLMARSDLVKRTACPGKAIGAFMAGAAVVRRATFLRAGGYHQRYHVGAEESLLALDLLDAGWELIYSDELTLCHDPSPANRDWPERRRLVLRNRLWTAWLRHSASCALRSTIALGRLARRDRIARAALHDALHGLPWVLRERRCVDRRVEGVVDRLIQLPA